MHLSSMYIALSNYKISKCYLFLLCVGQMTTDSICAVMHKADIQLQNWEKIAKSLNLDCIVLPVAFFNQWSALADQCHPSWKALARALESNQDHKYKQAAKKALQAEGNGVQQHSLNYGGSICIACPHN